MSSTLCDIENVIILVALVILFCLSLKRRQLNLNGGGNLLRIDLNMSHVLKGIACVFILLGHYGQRKSALMPDVGMISTMVWRTTANIGLVWFMFFSGYGLSLKHIEKSEVLGKWWKRLKKVYLPLLFTCVITTIIYFALPIKFDTETSKTLWIVPEIAAIHNGKLSEWLPGMFGWLDWYVFCIMIFYSLFYLSYYIMKKTGWNQTLILSIMMAGYFVWAHKVFGPPAAHWYRFIWTFLLGHIIARMKELDKSYAFLILLPFVALILLEGKIMVADYWLAIYGLLIVSVLNRYFEVNLKSAS